MRGPQQAVGQRGAALGVLRPGMIGHKPLPEVLVHGAHHGLQLAQHPFGQLAVMFGIFLDAIEHRRLDVGDDQPVEVVEQAAFHHFLPQGQAGFGLQVAALKPVKKKGGDHFMGLLVHLVQFHRPQLVVPAAHAGAGKHELQQTFA